MLTSGSPLKDGGVLFLSKNENNIYTKRKNLMGKYKV